MKQCADCKTPIGEQYIYCVKCNEKHKQEKTPDNDPLLKAIGAVNNNLYFLRRAAEIELREKYKIKIVWDKEKKDFTEKKEPEKKELK